MIPNPIIPLGLVPDKGTPAARDNARVLTPIPVSLLSVWVDYVGGVDAYLHIFESANLPQDGAAPSLPPIPLSAGSFYILDCTPGILMRGGVAVAISSVRDTLTKIATKDAIINGTFYPLPEA